MFEKLHGLKDCLEIIFLNIFELFLELVCLILWPIKFIGFKAHMFVYMADALLWGYLCFKGQPYSWVIPMVIFVAFPLIVILLKKLRIKIYKLAADISYHLIFPLSRADICIRKAIKTTNKELKNKRKNQKEM